MSAYPALSGRITTLLGELQNVVDRIALLSKKAQQTNDDGYWDGVALNLHSFYGGVERIFEDIARTVDETVPSGPGWHADLLLQMTSEIVNLRPVVIRPEARTCLDEYRGFRHVVRNVYAFNLRPARIKELSEGLGDCWKAIWEDLQKFIEFLNAVR
jgi:HepT-like protein